MTVKKTILCVDDEQSLSIEKLTLQTRGYRVTTCNTAREAIRLLESASFDLVVSNFDLPDATATELVSAFKALAPKMPVVLLSPRRRVTQNPLPVDLLLQKESYAPIELLDGISQLLTKRKARRSMPDVLARSIKVS